MIDILPEVPDSAVNLKHLDIGRGFSYFVGQYFGSILFSGPVIGPTGNPVKIRSGPAAVISLVSAMLIWKPSNRMGATVVSYYHGKAVAKARKPEDLPENN